MQYYIQPVEGQLSDPSEDQSLRDFLDSREAARRAARKAARKKRVVPNSTDIKQQFDLLLEWTSPYNYGTFKDGEPKYKLSKNSWLSLNIRKKAWYHQPSCKLYREHLAAPGKEGSAYFSGNPQAGYSLCMIDPDNKGHHERSSAQGCRNFLVQLNSLPLFNGGIHIERSTSGNSAQGFFLWETGRDPERTKEAIDKLQKYLQWLSAKWRGGLDFVEVVGKPSYPLGASGKRCEWGEQPVDFYCGTLGKLPKGTIDSAKIAVLNVETFLADRSLETNAKQRAFVRTSGYSTGSGSTDLWGIEQLEPEDIECADAYSQLWAKTNGKIKLTDVASRRGGRQKCRAVIDASKVRDWYLTSLLLKPKIEKWGHCSAKTIEACWEALRREGIVKNCFRYSVWKFLRDWHSIRGHVDWDQHRYFVAYKKLDRQLIALAGKGLACSYSISDSFIEKVRDLLPSNNDGTSPPPLYGHNVSFQTMIPDGFCQHFMPEGGTMDDFHRLRWLQMENQLYEWAA